MLLVAETIEEWMASIAKAEATSRLCPGCGRPMKRFRIARLLEGSRTVDAFGCPDYRGMDGKHSQSRGYESSMPRMRATNEAFSHCATLGRLTYGRCFWLPRLSRNGWQA